MNSKALNYAIHGISLLIVICGGILSYADKWDQSLAANFPGWLVHSWPTVLFLAGLTDRVGKLVLTYLEPLAKIGTLLIVSSFFLCSCATNTGDPTKDARGRATNQALVEAAKVLGNVAVSSLFNAAQQEMGSGKVDWGNAATQGLYTNSTSIFNSDQITNVMNAYAGNQLPSTAQAAASAFDASNASPITKSQAIAAVISTAAGSPIVQKF